MAPPRRLRQLLTEPRITSGINSSSDDSLLPGWDLEAIADEILGLPRDRTVHTHRLVYTESELLRRHNREVPFGEDLQLFGEDSDGTVIYGGELNRKRHEQDEC